MENYKIENLKFTYPDREKAALCHINLTVSQGEFITLCGKSGCGKTTLLRLLKSALAPNGKIEGNITFCGKPLTQWDIREQTSKIGFVQQNPDNQIVTDKVWHELAFGLESLGYKTPEIRTRVSEMASFFGIQTWFHKKVTELSGGQKQLLNLASVMAMQPSVLILDEPTSQLDPIAAQEFLKTLEKINRELGTTVILTEHRLEEAFPMSDRVVVLDEGKIIADDIPRKVGEILKNTNHEMYLSLPAPMRIWGAVKNDLDCPLTVREGRNWLEEYAKNNTLNAELIPKAHEYSEKETVIEIKDAWFRYERDLPDVIKGLNVKVSKGELFAIVGGNGTGKTTALSLISRINTPYRGKVLINGEEIAKINDLYSGVLGVLPQNPQTLFVKKTVGADLAEIVSDKTDEKIKNIAKLCRISELLESHPYDLSGGEQQRAALAKVLLKSPEILLLDEPTKGMDANFKKVFAEILEDLRSNGVTIVMVSHDIEFCAEYADRCALFFDGNITSVGTPREFFAGKNFYTTVASRMARTRLPEAVLTDDIILACGGNVSVRKHTKPLEITLPKEEKQEVKKSKDKKIAPQKIVCGFVLAVLFIFTYLLQRNTIDAYVSVTIQFLSLIEITACLLCFIPKKEFSIEISHQPRSERKLTKRTLFSAIFALVAIPLTIFVGAFYLEHKKYYFISLLVILETLIPFLTVFESRKPAARELIVISVLCAIGVAGRAVFFVMPQFKPVAAIVIISAVCFGAETGFLVGAVTGFVSNFFFGQSVLTPWQMVAFGMIGFAAGILFRKGLLRKTKLSLCIFGGMSTLIIYGGIMNPASVITWQPTVTWEMIILSYIMGIPFDLMHAASSAFFLWFIAEPMIEKLERIKAKYALIEK